MHRELELIGKKFLDLFLVFCTLVLKAACAYISFINNISNAPSITYGITPIGKWHEGYMTLMYMYQAITLRGIGWF